MLNGNGNLVITRKDSQSVTLQIDDEIIGTITIQGTARAKLLFKLDRVIRVVRSELLDRKPERLKAQ